MFAFPPAYWDAGREGRKPEVLEYAVRVSFMLAAAGKNLEVVLMWC